MVLIFFLIYCECEVFLNMITDAQRELIYPELSYKIIGCAFGVFNELGYGHKEIIYQNALEIKFKSEQIEFKSQLYCPIKFQNELIGKSFLDFLVEGKIIVEIKKAPFYSKKHIEQVYQYLVQNNLKLGLIINFGPKGVDFRRILNVYEKNPNTYKYIGTNK
jgi:GxxExxY protein